MPLHPDAVAFLAELEQDEQPMPWDAASAAEARSVLATLFVAADEPIPVEDVEERVVPVNGVDMTMRVFTPTGEPPFPVLLWFHGGGWVVGSLDEADAVCRSLCRAASAIVVCPDYRLAPEHRFPAAAEDCYAATCWAAAPGNLDRADTRCVAVAGDSAGGNLAAVVSLMARDRGGPYLSAQVLVYPVTGTPGDGRASYDEFAEGYFLTRRGMEWFSDLYARTPADLDDPQLAPLRARDLSGLPPALVITAEFDPLRDEGEEYARRLQEDGTPAELVRFDRVIHAFFILMEQFEDAGRAHELVALRLREAFEVAV